jgi:hypothetical protein
MSFSWWNIRTFNNSQNNAFEELVCQLARNEPISDKKSFFRMGTPDGGVESYCILENGDEYGWQAKFFNTVGKTQWTQLEKSFKTAIEKHNRLIKYYICLPLDRSDPRITDQDWFMDKWEKFVSDMKKYANTKNRNIEFEYWGSSEIIDRLSREVNKGKLYFWFNQFEFTEEWFFEKSKNSVDALENRYTPKLNFELKIAENFSSISLDNKFKEKLRNFVHETVFSIKKIVRFLNSEEFNKEKKNLENISIELQSNFNEGEFTPSPKIDYDYFLNSIIEINKLVENLRNVFDELKDKEFEDRDKKIKRRDPARFNYQLSLLNNIENVSYNFNEFLDSSHAKLSNNPILIIKGGAGMGKSHLLGDITTNLIKQEKPVIFLLGNHFVTEENPWTQISHNLLNLKCTEEEFWGAVNARGEALGERILIIIDAINEGKGLNFWNNNLRGFINKIAKFNYLGLVLSYRTSFEKLLIPESIFKDERITFITHIGFAYHEYEASKLFFSNYGIEFPDTPILHPEFSNPLFLKLFCEGIYKSGLKKIPKGFTGISQIINFFVNSINNLLSLPSRLDYPEEINLVKKTIEIFIDFTVDNDIKNMPYQQAFILFEEELSRFSKKSKLLDNLISEGLFNKDIYYTSESEYLTVIYLAYQRFDEHLTASLLLEKYLDKNNPQVVFEEGGNLHKYVKDENSCFEHQGLIESFSIQIPELINLELYELVPKCISSYTIIDSFLESLVWRKSESIKEKTMKYINEYLFKDNRYFADFFDTIFLITSVPGHFYNADYLHNYLIKFSLADRDAMWGPLIQENFLYKKNINRIIDWALKSEDHKFINDESRILMSKTLSWFLTSSNRYLRDKSTKAIISLLSNRLRLVADLLRNFEEVNDPYVLERLYAIAYGCSLRSADKSDLDVLCNCIYNTIFNKKEIFPNILLRDYARGVIEYAIHIGINLSFETRKAKPPYKSDFPKYLPSNEEIDKKYKIDYHSSSNKDYYYSQNDILSSMTTEYGRGIAKYGDFGRYTFESALKNWYGIDANLLSNWAVERVFELGYNVEKHGPFDRNQGSGRHNGHNERIGKKYQWIAFYEILARVSDNFKLKDPTTWAEKKYMKYNGPWEPYVRDFDPSTLLFSTKKERFESRSENWWFNNFPKDWDTEDNKWLKSFDEIPDPISYLCVCDPYKTEWFNLVLYPSWDEPLLLGEDKHEYPHKSLEYNIKSYFVSKKDLKKIKDKKINEQNIQSATDGYRDTYQIFSREYYWSPAYKDFSKNYYSGEFISKIKRPGTKSFIKLITPVEYFLWEEEFDCSKEEAITYYLPTDFLFNGMEMQYSVKDGYFENKDGEIICYDPSIENNSVQCLLVHKLDLIEFLEKNELTIIWLFSGEKRIDSGFSEPKNLDKLELYGLYYFEDNKVCGAYNSKFIPFKLRK